MTTPTPQMRKDWLIWAAVMLPATLLFWLTDWDLAWSGYYYREGAGWPLGEQPFWRAVRLYGVVPGMVLTVLALVAVSLSYWSVRWLPWRKPALTWILVIALGPGIMVNLILKDHWGRPRPRDVIEFGGTKTHQQVWVKGTKSNGKSFPCGHCSMGYLLAVPFLLLRHRYRRAAWLFLVGGLGFGLLISYARLIAGAHFPSDALWSAGMVWLAGLLAYAIVRPDIPLQPRPANDPAQRKKARRIMVVMGGLLPVLILSLLLATPYISQKSLTIPAHQLVDHHSIHAQLTEAQVALRLGSDSAFRASYRVNAFGLPLSKIGAKWERGDTARYLLRHQGWFSEVGNRMAFTFPINLVAHGSMHLPKGDVQLWPSVTGQNTRFELTIGQGEATVWLPANLPLQLNIVAEEVAADGITALEHDGKSYYLTQGAPPYLQLIIHVASGRVTLCREVRQ